jgi:hypothetical protein
MHSVNGGTLLADTLSHEAPSEPISKISFALKRMSRLAGWLAAAAVGADVNQRSQLCFLQPWLTTQKARMRSCSTTRRRSLVLRLPLQRLVERYCDRAYLHIHSVL